MGVVAKQLRELKIVDSRPVGYLSLSEASFQRCIPVWWSQLYGGGTLSIQHICNRASTSYYRHAPNVLRNRNWFIDQM
ncbi:hypothetical protein ES703_105368 [subsurface metagenome]